ncbi:MAG: 16S rRNA (cytosine(967)-C(5))-methyltransferase RsmB [Legionellaceae bacterium]|nr:16S rRNA (cytosine(967)-C(5))-methyltransferase RsmB [Legionellaceae bacterium]
MTSKKQNERALALEALSEVVEKKQSLSHLKTKLTPFAQALCFGVCRHYTRLSAITEQLLKKPLKKPKVQLVLLIGLYQLRELDLPEYAVLHETVALLNQPNLAWAKSLVNAVLRRYCREREAINQILTNHSTYLYSYPDWLLKRIQKSWPNHWKDIIHHSNQHPPMNLRVNAKHNSRKAYQSQLQAQNIEVTPLLHTTHGLQLNHPVDVHTLPGFQTGDVSIQDGAAQIAASLLSLEPGLRILDACAAPGGKTCHILETEPKLKACFALDVDAKRLTRTAKNLSRLSLKATLITGDATKPDTWWDGQLFDRILLDAPCSATGVIRRHPDIKLLRTPKDISQITQVQTRMLNALWPLLEPGGILVYATCSILPEENEIQIASFIQQNSDCSLSPSPQDFGHSTGHGWQILPGEQAMDGFFYSVLHKAYS